MRLLWVGKRPASGAAGDEIFDNKTISACRAQGHSLDVFHPAQVGRFHELASLLSGVAHYRARFASAANRGRIRDLAADYDAVICSWEPFDMLVDQLAPPAILIVHNVTSRALPALFPGSRLAAFAAARARAWEQTCYRRQRLAAIGCLSRRDLEDLRRLDDPPDLFLLPPGMPRCVALAADATLRPELVVTGTFDWVPKRRDVMAFAREYARVPQRLVVRADGLPAEVARHLQPMAMAGQAELQAGLRFGLITDRFEAGHKLKTLAYIAANQIVLSFADVGFDFAHIEDHALFIRRIGSVSDIADQVAAVAAMPVAALRDRFLAFQLACARAFTWDAVAAELLKAAAAAAARRQMVAPQA